MVIKRLELSVALKLDKNNAYWVLSALIRSLCIVGTIHITKKSTSVFGASMSYVFKRLPVTDDIASISSDGKLILAGNTARSLVERFGSPLVVMLEEVIRKRCREYRERIEFYPRSRVYYASKAFLTVGFCKLIEQEGLGLDVVSSGELHTAIKAGFPPDMVLMHGNAKTDEELTLALEYGVGRIVIDNLAEIDKLAILTRKLGKRAKVLLRVTPGVKPHTHKYVQTGQTDSKFGFNLDGGTAEDAAKRVLEVPELEFVGIHCHIGSQIFEYEIYSVAARLMMEFYAYARNELGAPLDEINMGGGLGIKYLPEDAPPRVSTHIEHLVQTINECVREYNLPLPVLCDEPGRSIVGEAGVTLYTVQSVKKIPGIRNYASVDGGMTDNPRHALYGSRHYVLLAERANERPTGAWSISGKCCESGDMLASDVPLPEPSPGDLLAMLSTGAYTYSMASNYNRVPYPAVILAGANGCALLARRETPEDVTALDEVPVWLDTR